MKFFVETAEEITELHDLGLLDGAITGNGTRFLGGGVTYLVNSNARDASGQRGAS
jgi:hypothetical protein